MGKLQSTLEYIEQICGSLSYMSKRTGYDTISYLLEMAQLEAQQQQGIKKLSGGVKETGFDIGVWDWDLSQDLCHVDKTTARLFELSDDERSAGVPASRFWSVMHPDDVPGVKQVLEEVRRSGGERRFEFRVVKGDETVHWIQTYCTVTRDHEGRAYRIAGANLDMTKGFALAL